MHYKTLFALTIYIGFAYSCNKDDNNNTDEPIATFRFRMNGTAIRWDGPGEGSSACILCGPHIRNHTSYFTLSSSAPRDYAEALVLQINATALNQGTYADTLRTPVDYSQAAHRLTISPFISPLISAATEIGDFATVTITSIKDGKYYDGTFAARLTTAPYGPTAPKVMIEQGEFHNVRKVY